MAPVAPSYNRAKIRAGLVVIAAIFLAAAVLFVVVDDAVGRAVFFAVAVMALVRVIGLVRWARREARSS